jgi:hypothetical protein
MISDTAKENEEDETKPEMRRGIEIYRTGPW